MEEAICLVPYILKENLDKKFGKMKKNLENFGAQTWTTSPCATGCTTAASYQAPLPFHLTRQMLEHHGANLMNDEGKDFMATKCEFDRVSYSKIQISIFFNL